MNTARRVILETPSPTRERELIEAVARSRQLHGDWAQPPRTAAEYATYLQRLARPENLGFFVSTSQGQIAGVINVTEIVRGVFLSGYLGYYALVPHEGRGYMSEGIRLVLDTTFREHGLHRLEANIQPENTRSLRLIESLGFRREGFSPRYLRLAGEWRDHERWAITAEEWADRGRGDVTR